MTTKRSNPLKIAWQIFSFILVLYGFYLLFLFFLDTFIRINESVAFPLALILTVISMIISAVLWGRNYIETARRVYEKIFK